MPASVAPASVGPAFAPVSAGPAVAVSALDAPSPALGAPAFAAPASGRVMRAFDPPPAPWLAGHRGVDLASSPGTIVGTAGPGRVVFSGLVAGRGVVSVEHQGGLRTTYEPVLSTVTVGDVVGTGESIGTLAAGHPGCAVEACLHWGLRRGSAYLDPLLLLGLGQVRLKPL
ncbi:peptidoglycan DD-metalloendopeptidase family protein [Actinoplanes sp. NPDC051633]|uniref:murein hydrolase activator EnvC family protein n=1 Tax=Actinoplanes sp. NPDC051633 TaxID=3155670 RepID=UPI00341872A3